MLKDIYKGIDGARQSQVSQEGLMRKHKIYQKAVHICIQQVDRIVLLFNKIMLKVKLKNFRVTLVNDLSCVTSEQEDGRDKQHDIKEELAKRVINSQRAIKALADSSETEILSQSNN